MDIRSLWNDDPADVLLDLGFGIEEPDLSGRIPARFINYQSQARGINLQVFLEAQKNRLDLENPDVNNRFRQVEVFQQVTTAFSSLVGSSTSRLRESQGTDLPPEALDKRRRVGGLFRWALKKSLNQIHNNKTQDPTTPTAASTPCVEPQSLKSPINHGEGNALLKEVRHGLDKLICIDPQAENPESQPHMHTSLTVHTAVLKPWPLGKDGLITSNSCLQRKALSGAHADSQNSERPGSLFFDSSSSLQFFSNQTSPGDKSLLPSPCSSPGYSFVFEPSPSTVSVCVPILDLQVEKTPDHDQSTPAPLSTFGCEYLPFCSSSANLQIITHNQSHQDHPSPAYCMSLLCTSTHLQYPSIIGWSENIKTEKSPSPHHSTLSLDFDSAVFSTHLPSAISQNLDCSFSATISMSSALHSSGCLGSTLAQKTDMASYENSRFTYGGLSFLFPSSSHLPSDTMPELHCPYLSASSQPIESLSHGAKNNQRYSLCSGSDATGLSGSPTNRQNKDEEAYSHDGSPDLVLASPLPDAIHVKMNTLSLNSEDNFQLNGRTIEAEKCRNTEQTTEMIVYSVSAKSTANSTAECNQIELKPLIPLCISHIPIETKIEELGHASEMEINVIENELPKSPFILHDISEVQSTANAAVNDLIEIDNLDLDSLQGENGDVAATFQQDEWLVYWAEPMQVSNQTPANSLLTKGPAALIPFPSPSRVMPSSFSSSITLTTGHNLKYATACSDNPFSLSLAPVQSLSTLPELKTSSQSLSVWMSQFSQPSHIVHRKDIPYMVESKRTLLPSILPLDTSTPFRAVQSWAVQQIQQNTLTKTLPHRDIHTVKNKVAAFQSSSEMTQKTKSIFSSSPSLLSPSKGVQTCECFLGKARSYQTVSLNNDLWLNEDNRNGSEDKEKLLDCNNTVDSACDHRCTCCTAKSFGTRDLTENVPYFPDVLEEMMLCLQQFCSVLHNIEGGLFEDKSAVDSHLSDQDRKNVCDIEKLKQMVKNEAVELEIQLKELGLHYDESLKWKMHRLLDEQFLLCSELRVFVPGMVPSRLSTGPKRTIATQCCLLPITPPANRQRRCEPNQSPSGSESIR